MRIPSRIVLYLKTLANILIELTFLSIVSFVLCAALLYVGDMFWFLYLETPMGQKFVASFQDQAGSIIEIFSFDILRFSIDLTVSALLVCIAVSCCSRLLHISRHLYLSGGFFSKLFFWGFPLTALVTLHICNSYGFEDYRIVGLFAAVPTFCLFMSCFKYSDQLLPEFGDLARSSLVFTREAWAWAIVTITAADYEDIGFACDRFREKMEAYLKKLGLRNRTPMA